MSQEIYAVDLDETLLPFDEPFLTWHNQTHGTNFLPDAASHNYAKDYDAGIDWSMRLDEFVESNLQHEHPPLPHSQVAINALARQAKLVVVTARPEHHRQYTENWLDDNFSGLFAEIHMRKEKFNSHRKGVICQAIGATVLLDDAVHHIDSALEHGVRGIVFGDYKKQLTALMPHHERAKDWQQVLELLVED